MFNDIQLFILTLKYRFAVKIVVEADMCYGVFISTMLFMK